jgi:aryl-alcohol dehydrogenase-like predicted oxidoreductase
MTAPGLRLVLGTADLRDDSLTPRLLDQFHDAGGRAIDVANVYGGGESERAVGKWLRGRGVGPVLYAKGCHPPSCQPDLVAGEVETALESLGVDRLDVFMLHRDDPSVDIRAWSDALLEQLRRGTVDSIGVSNWTPERFFALRDCLHELGEEGVTVFSNHFSLAAMAEPPWPACLAMDAPTAARIAASGITVLAWASLAGGYLADGGNTNPSVLRSWDTESNRVRRARATKLAERLGTSTATIALAYVLAHEGVRPIVGTRSHDHLSEALAAEGVELTPEQLDELEADGPA